MTPKEKRKIKIIIITFNICFVLLMWVLRRLSGH